MISAPTPKPGTWAIVIVDSVTNDFVGSTAPDDMKVHVGKEEAYRLLGEESTQWRGPLTLFLEQAIIAQQEGNRVGIINVRDLHNPDDEEQMPELLRHGKHCMKDTPGAEVVAPVKAIYDRGRIEYIDVHSLSIPIFALREAIREITTIDIIEDWRKLENIIFVIVGTHTNIRIVGTANTLRHQLSAPNVLVCPHLVASNNRQAHIDALRIWMPDLLIQVVQSVGELCQRIGILSPPQESIHWQE